MIYPIKCSVCGHDIPLDTDFIQVGYASVRVSEQLLLECGNDALLDDFDPLVSSFCNDCVPTRHGAALVVVRAVRDARLASILSNSD